MFKDSISNTTTDPFKPKSTFCPSTDNIYIKCFEKAVERDFNKLTTRRQPYHSNLSELERTTLVKLSNLKEVVWKPADKGGAIVLLNKRDYIKEVNLQLSNSKFYQPIATDPTKHIQSLIRVVCQEGLSMGFISSSTFKYLQNDFPRIPIFYILPKIHKGIIPPPGRPIISGSSSVLEPVAKYLDSFCQPFVPLCDSYIKDTKHFINIVENLNIEEDSILVTIDVTSLYTNIPLDEARTIIENILRRRTKLQPPTHFLMDLLDIVLEKNYFRFQNQFYFQTFGVAMGSPLAPSIANLFMAHLENTILHNPSLNMYYSNIIYYGRFIDDIFIVFKTTEAAVGFSNWINTIHTSIKFTSHLNLSHINFLDVTVYKHHNKLLVKNFRKPSDKNSFLHYNSFHHFGLKTNLPFSQLLRLKRNSSSNEHFIHESLTLSQEFRSRGYPKHVIKKALIKAEKTDRTTLLKESAKPTKNQIIWTQELSHYSKHIIQIIKKHWHLLQDIPGCDKLPIFGNRRTKNIREYLIHTDLTTPISTPKSTLRGHYPCGHCKCCPQSWKTKEIYNHRNKVGTTLKHFSTCNSNNVIYLLTCDCDLWYIGKTTRSLRIRISEHKSRIKNLSTESLLYSHFTQYKHSPTSFKFCVLECISQKPFMDLEKLLSQREMYWIFKFKTFSPQGLNESLNFSCFL
ncbi:uncharacterized protein LOC134298951 [Anolis carolinensis]|uniref:uncharacterized protein LOC134298951 n=1 Tax=Anolis carolinensis TaxID=28377 RepID=UPI002F2B3D79